MKERTEFVVLRWCCMKVRFLVLVSMVVGLSLAGCMASEGPYFVWGDKISPGHCRQPGVVDVALVGFRPLPNATLLFSVQNLWSAGVSVQRFGIIGANGDEPSEPPQWRWERPREADWLKPGESATVLLDLQSLPDSPWQRIQFSYGYADEDGLPDDNPTNMQCSLKGDDAPWAFQTPQPDPIPMDLNSWEPGWTLAYLSDQGQWLDFNGTAHGRWTNYTYEGPERIAIHDGAEWDTHRWSIEIAPARDDEDGRQTGWLDQDTLGLVRVKGESLGSIEAACPIHRILPLENTSYSCSVWFRGRPFATYHPRHWTLPAKAVQLDFGVFNESVVREAEGWYNDETEWSTGYSMEIGFMTRFGTDVDAGGEEFRLVSARNLPPPGGTSR